MLEMKKRKEEEEKGQLGWAAAGVKLNGPNCKQRAAADQPISEYYFFALISFTVFSHGFCPCISILYCFNMSPTRNTLHVSTHPIVLTKLTILRDKNSSSKVVRDTMRDLTVLLGYEVTKDLELQKGDTVSSSLWMLGQLLWFTVT
jgi:Uracil phosphoribosyltransferase